ncbi:MAG: FAD-binding oxidoreductase, partial [Rhodospirillaceae bacterium]|nr:FAD-binding oxidoreductase [Rhodospirillaceae bacterium]
MPPISSISAKLLAALREIVGTDRVITDAPQLAYYATDISGESDVRPSVVVRPNTVDHLARAVGLLTRAGVAVIPRGGGYSSTGGYRPLSAKSAIIDTGDLNQIVEINETD